MKIRIDSTLCKMPDTCMKCVQACPAKIFVIKPSGTNLVDEKYETVVLFKDLCSGCMKCVEACPRACIHLEF